MSYLIENYDRFPYSFVKGDGCNLYDIDGKCYLDFTSGISVVNLGHCNNEITNIICDQASKLVHTSNLFVNNEQEALAEVLSKLTNKGYAFFCNSGAEANEAAIKLVRAYGNKKYEGLRYKIITMENSFHGRTYATLSATGQKKVQHGFEPVADFFIHVPFNDFDTFYEVSQQNKVVAVMMELIQGEGGVIEANKAYIDRLMAYCKSSDIVVICDEVQTGMGRTGEFICSKHYNIEPDIITMAKALGNGLPIGAMIAKEKLAHYFSKGSHGSTFGGNHLACRVAKAVVEKISEKKFLEEVNQKGNYLRKKLQEILSSRASVRGLGLMIGVAFTDVDAKEFINKAMEDGLLLIPSAHNCIRVYPPLTVSIEEIDKAVEIFEKVLRSFKI
jgi:predicted acetylornithine/succinylornithine family transaminase